MVPNKKSDLTIQKREKIPGRLKKIAFACAKRGQKLPGDKGGDEEGGLQ